MNAAAAVIPRVPEGADVFDRLGPRWTRIDHVPFGTGLVVEHVLLSTTALAVVTTVEAVPPSQHPISEARWRARKIGFLLDRVARVEVLPVLVVPGPGPLGSGMRDGVLVAAAGDAVTWLAHLDETASFIDTASIDTAGIDAMIDVLVHHTQRTEQVNATYAR